MSTEADLCAGYDDGHNHCGLVQVLEKALREIAEGGCAGESTCGYQDGKWAHLDGCPERVAREALGLEVNCVRK